MKSTIPCKEILFHNKATDKPIVKVNEVTPVQVKRGYHKLYYTPIIKSFYGCFSVGMVTNEL